MLRVLYVNNSRVRGGGEEYLRDLLPGLSQKAVKTGIVCRPGSPLESMFHRDDIEVYTVSRSGMDSFSSVMKLSKIISKNGYNIINIQRGHDIIQSYLSFLLSCNKPKGAKILYTVQIPEFFKSKFLLRRLDGIIAVSNYIKGKLLSYCPSLSNRVKVINYGIDLPNFTIATIKGGFVKYRFNLPPGAKIIGTVGDLWKNQIEFLDSLAQIRVVYPNTYFAIAGTESGGPGVQEFNSRAHELNLSEAILWTGRLSKVEMPLFYADIDLAISTHRNEGFGIWILESLAMGRPVIAFNAGGIMDSLSGCPGGCLIDGGAKEMAEEIIKIFKDKNIYDYMSRAAPLWVRKGFSKARMIEDYYCLFHSLSPS